MSHCDCSKKNPINQIRKLRFVCRDVEKIREGIAEKVSHFLFMVFGFVVFIGIAFGYGWKLSLVVCAYLPILMITSVIIGKV